MPKCDYQRSVERLTSRQQSQTENVGLQTRFCSKEQKEFKSLFKKKKWKGLNVVNRCTKIHSNVHLMDSLETTTYRPLSYFFGFFFVWTAGLVLALNDAMNCFLRSVETPAPFGQQDPRAERKPPRVLRRWCAWRLPWQGRRRAPSPPTASGCGRSSPVASPYVQSGKKALRLLFFPVDFGFMWSVWTTGIDRQTQRRPRWGTEGLEERHWPPQMLLCDGGGGRIHTVRAFGGVALCDPSHFQLHHLHLKEDSFMSNSTHKKHKKPQKV